MSATAQHVRQWAWAQGMDIPPRGALRLSVIRSYNKAHPDDTFPEPKTRVKHDYALTPEKSAAALANRRKLATEQAMRRRHERDEEQAEAVGQASYREVRDWALGRGVDMHTAGKLPAQVIAGYNRVHPDRQYVPRRIVRVASWVDAYGEPNYRERKVV